MIPLSKKEIEEMKHCIGLDYKKPYTRHGKKFYKPYRNRYADYVFNELWNSLVRKKYARHWMVDRDQRTAFYLTRKGLDILGDAIGVHIYDVED